MVNTYSPTLVVVGDLSSDTAQERVKFHFQHQEHDTEPAGTVGSGVLGTPPSSFLIGKIST
jgi:hypothetical protein